MHLKKHDNPYQLFEEWFTQAKEHEPAFPDAATLATVNADGMPSVRMMLVKSVDEDGFVFYTNLGSRKAAALTATKNAALCFHWKSLEKQVRVEGRVEPVSADQADAYFASRPRTSKLGAWASRQSQRLNGRFELEAEVARFAAKFHIGTIPRPSFWSGFRLHPERIEFWIQGAYRLHDRLEYRRGPTGWETHYLYP